MEVAGSQPGGHSEASDVVRDQKWEKWQIHIIPVLSSCSMSFKNKYTTCFVKHSLKPSSAHTKFAPIPFQSLPLFAKFILVCYDCLLHLAKTIIRLLYLAKVKLIAAASASRQLVISCQ